MVKKQKIRYKERICNSCDERATRFYCSDCEDEQYGKLVDARKSKTHLCFLIFLFIMTSIGIPCITYGSGFENIDENQFCLDKLRAEFPEYNFNSATGFDRINTLRPFCRGEYNIQAETRDGLTEVGDLNSKDYLLNDEKDIEYINSDNDRVYWWLGFILIFVGILIYGCYWLDRYIKS